MDFKPTKDLLDVVINNYSAAQKALVVAEALEELSNADTSSEQMLVEDDIDAIMDSVESEEDRTIFNETIEKITHLKKSVEELEKIVSIYTTDIFKFNSLYRTIQDNAEVADMLNDILSNDKIDANAKKAISSTVMNKWASLSAGELSLENNEFEYTTDENVEETLENLHDEIHEGVSISKTLGNKLIQACLQEDIKLNSIAEQTKNLLTDLQESLDEISEEIGFSYDEVPESDEIDECC